MTIDVILIVISLLCLLSGMAGCFAPAMPGLPLSYCGLLVLNETHQVHFSTAYLIVTLLFVLLIQLWDYFIPMLDAKISGGTKWRNYGSLAGSLLGLFFFPLGLLLSPFAGAFLGELMGGEDIQTSLKSGAGTLIGFLAGTFIKCVFCMCLLLHCFAFLNFR